MATNGWTTCGFGGRIAKYQIQAATAAAGITTIAAPRTVSLIRMKNPRPSARTIFPHASAIVRATAGRNLFSRTGFGRTSVLARVLVGGGAGTGAGVWSVLRGGNASEPS